MDKQFKQRQRVQMPGVVCKYRPPPLRVIGEINDEYIQRMENVLDTYNREAEPGEVRLCLDRSGEL